MPDTTLRFWGVRGSTPSPSRATVGYGGNTSCIEIACGREQIICDAGTGMRLLGEKIARSGQSADLLILISHIHWDHIAGLPFFRPLYDRRSRITIAGPPVRGASIRSALNKVIAPPYFPISIKNAHARLKFRTVIKPFFFGRIKVAPFKLHHPGGALGWRLDLPGGRRIICISDNEPGKKTRQVVNTAGGADIMIHDAQYTPEEYARKKGWGHSPYTYPLELAKAAGAKRLILTHFDPSYSDAKLRAIAKKAKALGKNFRCTLAREGLTVRI